MNEEKNVRYFFDEIYEVKLLYAEIIRGYSYDFESKIYVKHLSELEKIEIIEKRQEIYNISVSRGVKTDKQAVGYLISQDLWSEEKEEEIASFEMMIEDNTKQADLIVSSVQKKVVMDLVGKDRAKLELIKEKRADLIGLTAEKYADDKYINYYLYYSFFKDAALSEHFFSETDFKDLEESDISRYFLIYSKCLKKLNPKNMKKICVSPFFLNSISFAYEDPKLFLNKTYNQYSCYQLELHSLGKRNVKVLSETSTNPPVIHSRTLFQDMINWYDLQYTVNENARKERDGSARGSVRKTIRN